MISLRSLRQWPFILIGLALLGAALFGGASAISSARHTTSPSQKPEQVQTAAATTTTSSDNNGYFLPEYDSSPPWNNEQTDVADTGWGMATDIFLKLGLVLFIIYGTAWGVKRFRSWTRPSLANGQSIRVVETAYVAPQRALHLVEVQGQTFLIGATEQNLSLIAALSPAQEELLSPLPLPAQSAPDRPTADISPPERPTLDAADREKRSFGQLLTEMETRVERIRQQLAERQLATSASASTGAFPYRASARKENLHEQY